MKKYFVSIVCLCAGIALMSCSKDDEDASSVKYLPKKMYGTAWGKSWSATFEYDGQDRLVKTSTPKYIMGVVYSSQSTYEIKLYNEGSEPFKVFYAKESGNTIEVKEVEYNNGKEAHSEEFYYVVENGRIVRNHSDYGIGTYTYDASGNMVGMQYASSGSAQPQNRTFKYDNKKGVFSDIKTPSWILWDILDIDQVDDPLFFINNITEFYDDDKLEIKYGYTYNADSYPTDISITEYYDTGDDKIDVKIEY